MTDVIPFPINTSDPIPHTLNKMVESMRRKPLVEQIDDILASGDRQKISDTRKQLLFGVDLIDCWLEGQ